MQESKEVQSGSHGASTPQPLSGPRPPAKGGGGPDAVLALNVRQRGLGGPHGLSRDSRADRDLPPQPYGLPKIIFVPPDLTSTDYWRLQRAIETLRQA